MDIFDTITLEKPKKDIFDTISPAISLDKKSPEFKEFALSKEGSGAVAAASPEVAAKIAAKEQPSRNDLKELGISGWNAEERKRLSSLFRDVNQQALTIPPTGIPDIVDPQGLTGNIQRAKGEDPLLAAKQIPTGLARGTEGVIGAVGSMARWAVERATIGNILTKHQDLPYGSGAVAEYLVRKYGPDKPIEFFDKKMAEHAEMGKKWADFWEEQAQKGWEAPDPEVTQAKWREMPITKGAATISEAAPNYLAAIAGSVLTKSPQTGLLFISGLSGAGAYRRQREAGGGVVKADAIATMTAAWEYVTEKVPFDEVFKPAKSKFLKMLKLGTMESAQEFVQGIGENFLEYFGYTAKDLDSVPAAVKEGLAHTMDGWVENVVAGFGLGVMGAGIVPQRGMQKAAAAEVTPEQRQQAIDYVKGVLSQEQYADLDEKAKGEIGQRMLAEQGVEVEAEELAETPATEAIPEPQPSIQPQTPAEGVEIAPAKKKAAIKGLKPEDISEGIVTDRAAALPQQDKKPRTAPESLKAATSTEITRPESLSQVEFENKYKNKIDHLEEGQTDEAMKIYEKHVENASEIIISETKKLTNIADVYGSWGSASSYYITVEDAEGEQQIIRLSDHAEVYGADVNLDAEDSIKSISETALWHIKKEFPAKPAAKAEGAEIPQEAKPPAKEALAKAPAEPEAKIEGKEVKKTPNSQLQKMSSKWLDKRLEYLGLDPQEYANLASKRQGIRDAENTIILAQAPAQAKPKSKGLKEKAPGKRGSLNVEPLLKAIKIIPRTFYRIFEPARLARKTAGGEAVAAVTKGTYGKRERAILEFEQKQLAGLDKSLAQLEEYLNKYPNEMLEYIMLTRGHGLKGLARRSQIKAFAVLPKELKDPKLRRAIDEIADYNYERLQEVAGDDINRVEDYFYGIYKNPKKVTAFLKYWKTTDRFTKHKIFPTYADAKAYGMEIRNPNPITNLKSEYAAIAQLSAVQWLRDELMRTGQGKYIDKAEVAPDDWEVIGEGARPEPTFKDVRVEPDLAKLINNLISTNKITRIPFLNAIRFINNTLRTIKFIGSSFHLLNIAKQSIADTGYFALYRATSRRGLTSGFRKNDPIFKTPEYRDYIENGGGHKYSVESEARRSFANIVNQMTKTERVMIKAGGLPFQIPLSFVDWMFESYIPKVKYAKYLDYVAEKQKKLGRNLEADEKQEAIKEMQNFYGMMNERLFGRSGTVTTLLRFWFMAPGYAEGNYRTIIKATTQWGLNKGHKAYRSRSNIINSLLVTGILSTIGTLIMTGKLPEPPETIEEMRDLLKIDTGKKDEKGNRIMIDLATYDKDYWNVAFNTLRGRPDVAIEESFRRIGGMKSPTSQMILDLALIAQGKSIYDWKEDKIYHITDPWLQKVLKTTVHEIRKTVPISSSVFRQTREQTENKVLAAVEAVLGLRPARSEKDRLEYKIIRDLWDMREKREELSYQIGKYDDPKKAIALYNRTIRNIIDSKFATDEIKQKGESYLIDTAEVIKWKHYPVKAMSDKELRIAFLNTVLKTRSSVTGRFPGQPKKGYEERYKELKAELRRRKSGKK